MIFELGTKTFSSLSEQRRYIMNKHKQQIKQSKK